MEPPEGAQPTLLNSFGPCHGHRTTTMYFLITIPEC